MALFNLFDLKSKNFYKSLYGLNLYPLKDEFCFDEKF